MSIKLSEAFAERFGKVQRIELTDEERHELKKEWTQADENSPENPLGEKIDKRPQNFTVGGRIEVPYSKSKPVLR